MLYASIALMACVALTWIAAVVASLSTSPLRARRPC